MICEHFVECGGCQIQDSYQNQLAKKYKTFKEMFKSELKDILIHEFTSPEEGFRARGEFRLHREEGRVYLSMNAYGENNRIKIETCRILLPILQDKLKILLEEINQNPILENKLYGIKVLSGLSNEVLITLIYHRKLDDSWHKQVQKLSLKLDCFIVGRSKGEKIVVTKSYINEILKINQEDYYYIQEEGHFSQPNPYINTQMIEFVIKSLKNEDKKDLLEMYCGSGNFTIALSKYFRKVFTTEIVKSCIKNLSQNIQNNKIQNITYARLSGKETIQAIKKQRDFFRLKNIDLDEFDFSHILLDPPRSGIDDKEMLDFIQNFKNIIYISCNPLSLKKDLKFLLQTHSVLSCAIFDQFPYTHHLECSFILQKKIF